jgi:hypothetical protein
MTKRIEVARAPAPLEAYCQHFDPLLGKSNQREGFRQYLEGLLLPSERNKTLTGLVNTEPVVGAELPRAQKLQWFLSESDWDERAVQAVRLKLLREERATAPDAQGVLVIDETGDRKDGHKTAHVGRQYARKCGQDRERSRFCHEPVGRRASLLPARSRTIHAGGLRGRRAGTIPPSARNSRLPCSLSSRRSRKGGLSVPLWLITSTERIVA